MARTKRWSATQLKISVSNANSVREVLKNLGLVPAGGNYVHITREIRQQGLDTAHFGGKGWRKGKRYPYFSKQTLESLLVEDSDVQSYKLKKRLFLEEIKKPVCEECGWSKSALDGRIPVELDHINGNRRDNRLFNLRILCPNCHSLKDTHRGRNKKR